MRRQHKAPWGGGGALARGREASYTPGQRRKTGALVKYWGGPSGARLGSATSGPESGSPGRGATCIPWGGGRAMYKHGGWDAASRVPATRHGAIEVGAGGERGRHGALRSIAEGRFLGGGVGVAAPCIYIKRVKPSAPTQLEQ